MADQRQRVEERRCSDVSTLVFVRRTDGSEDSFPLLPVTQIAFERHFGIGMAKAQKAPHIEYDCWLAWDAERKAGRQLPDFPKYVEGLADMRSAVVSYLDGSSIEVSVPTASFVAFEKENGVGMPEAGAEGRVEDLYWLVKDAVKRAGHVVKLTLDEWVEDIADVDIGPPSWAEAGRKANDYRNRPVRFEDRPNPLGKAGSLEQSPD